MAKGRQHANFPPFIPSFTMGPPFAPANPTGRRPFIGRTAELQVLRELLERPQPSLVTCQGRRRIGKSRLIEEAARHAQHFLRFEGLAPRPGLKASDQLAAFSAQLAAQTGVPNLELRTWSDAFQLLARLLPPHGSTVVLLDEVSWMAAGEPDFPGWLKVAWDQHFSPRAGVVLVLCGSVSSWIEDNILQGTGFVGRVSCNLRLDPLPLHEAAQFWGGSADRITAREKLKVLSVLGGVPRYLEQVDLLETADANVARLCLRRGAPLVGEFEALFHDLFQRQAGTYRRLVEALAPGSVGLAELEERLQRERGGSLSKAIEDLVGAGFLAAESPLDLQSGRPRPRQRRYRLRDNFTRFHLRCLEPLRERIEAGLFDAAGLDAMPGWDAVSGLLIESLVLDSRTSLLPHLRLEPSQVLAWGPLIQRANARRKGCQVDLVIRTAESLYVVEVKRRARLDREVISEVQAKVEALERPRLLSLRTVLLHDGEVAPAVRAADYFNAIVPLEALLRPPLA